MEMWGCHSERLCESRAQSPGELCGCHSERLCVSHAQRRCGAVIVKGLV